LVEHTTENRVPFWRNQDLGRPANAISKPFAADSFGPDGPVMSAVHEAIATSLPLRVARTIDHPVPPPSLGPPKLWTDVD
jgi:hypothetical protein